VSGNIIDLKEFDGQVDALMLGMTCALLGSSVWVNNATRMGLAVSSSHSIVGATVGVGIAFRGPGAILWGNARTGVCSIILSWVLSPLMAGCLAALFFTLTKYGVLRAENSRQRMLDLYPLYVTTAFSVVLFFMVWAGAPRLHLTRDAHGGGHALANPGAVIGVVLALDVVVYAVAWRVRGTAWFARYIDVSAPAAEPKGAAADGTELALMEAAEDEHAPLVANKGSDDARQPAAAPGGLWARLRASVFSGMDADVVTPSDASAAAAHDVAERYDDATERLFSAAQVFTASFASLAHGANDNANAVSPLAVIFLVWRAGGSKVAAASPTPVWCLVYGAVFMDIGLVLCGYKVMRSLGNNLTYHSPSRGFCMELAALTTVLWASASGNPVSTTHCLTGATVAVGLCNGSLAGVNWRMVAWTTAGWVLTLPASALISGVAFAVLARSPKALSYSEAHPG
jgi:phosphate/sulfate permease